jgi:protocatechuate 3,4-dioxygenase beta subunit
MVMRDKRRANLSGNTVLWLALCLMSVASSAWGKGSQVYPMTGRVIDDQARPVEGAEVAAYDSSFISQQGLAHADANGQFRFELGKPYMDLVLVSQKPGLALGWIVTSDPRGTTVILGRPQRLAGTVVDEAGRPVPDATVKVILYQRNFARWRGDSSEDGSCRILALQAPEDWLTIKTDLEGRFAFDLVPVGASADLQVSAPGRARLCTHRGDTGMGCQFAAGRSDIRVVLDPEAAIQGRVVDEDSGRPQSGVRIAAIPEGLHARCCKEEAAVSDETGTFCFKGLAAGTYVLKLDGAKAAMPEWVGKDVEVPVKAGQARDDVRIPVSKGGILEVLVHDAETGDRMPGALVCVRQRSELAEHLYEGPTDANGLARFRLSSGQASIVEGTRKDGLGVLISYDEPVTIDQGQTRRCTVDLPHNACAVSGRVLDPNGRPVEAAWVRDLLHCITDKEGRFELSGWYCDPPSSSAELLVRQESLGLAAEAILRDPNKAGHPQGEVTLRPASTITGRVTDPQGRPVCAAYVTLLCKYNTRRITEVVTDANGTYRIPAIPASLSKSNSLTLLARVEGCGTREVCCPEFEDANRIVHLDPVVLEPATESVSGVVVDSKDRPAAGALLTVLGPDGREDQDQPFCHATADDQGRFRIEGVCKGPLRLAVADGYLDALGGAQDLKVVLGRRLVHTGQKPLSGKRLADLAEVGVMCDPNEFKDKSLLVCFIDVGQRPSRNLAHQLAKRETGLKERGVRVFLVQAEPAGPDTLSQWTQSSGVSTPIYSVPGDAGAVRNAWNVQSLPWLILTDRDHVVQAEGLSLEDLERWLEAAGNPRPR